MKRSSKYTGILLIGVVAITFFCYEYFVYFPKQLTEALLTMKSTKRYYTTQLKAEEQKAEL